MAGTTPNIGLNVPDYGDHNWNVPVNQNWNTLDTAIAGKQATLVSGTNIKTINNNSILGSGNVNIDALPSQTGQSGKFLTTNGTNASWTDINTGRNIGEIIQSTIPLSDAGLHLLDGALISGAGSYSAFVTYIAGLVSNYPDLFTTETAWQQAVTDYGVCGKFVYDSVNNTVRLPKITGFTEGTTDVTALGDLVEAGLPNIEGSTYIREAHGRFQGLQNNTGCIQVADSGVMENANGGGDAGGNMPRQLKINASLSSSIYGNSSTVQPQSVKVLYYIVIANSVKTDIEVDIDEVMTDLNGKVDKADLSPVQCVVEYYVNGSSWYRVWSADSNGKICVEQGGEIPASTTSITLLKEYKNTDYGVVMSGSNYGKADQQLGTKSKTVSSFTVETSTYARSWVAIGEGA